MEVICLEDAAFYSLIEQVFERRKEKQQDQAKGGFLTKRQAFLSIKSRTTLQKLRDEESIRFSQQQKMIILQDRYFMFSYYNRGMNFIDMAQMKWENISNQRLDYVRRKTKKNFTMALLEPAQAILTYYREHHYDGEDSFVFPILNPAYQTPASVRNRCHKVLVQVNADLKEIAKSLNLSEPRLTTYVARHTYATVMKRSGHSVAVISEALGHDSEDTTQIYLDSFGNDVLDEASKAIL